MSAALSTAPVAPKAFKQKPGAPKGFLKAFQKLRKERVKPLASTISYVSMIRRAFEELERAVPPVRVIKVPPPKVSKVEKLPLLAQSTSAQRRKALRASLSDSPLTRELRKSQPNLPLARIVKMVGRHKAKPLNVTGLSWEAALKSVEVAMAPERVAKVIVSHSRSKAASVRTKKYIAKCKSKRSAAKESRSVAPKSTALPEKVAVKPETESERKERLAAEFQVTKKKLMAEFSARMDAKDAKYRREIQAVRDRGSWAIISDMAQTVDRGFSAAASASKTFTPRIRLPRTPWEAARFNRRHEFDF